MLGLNARTGQPLSGIDHLRQSIRDILTTRIGARVMRREYGSLLPGLVDNPMPPGFAMDLYAATAQALARWEPRFSSPACALPPPRPGGSRSISKVSIDPRARRSRLAELKSNDGSGQSSASLAIETLSFEAIFLEVRAEFQARYPDYSALLVPDPAIKLLEVAAYREVLLRNRINATGLSPFWPRTQDSAGISRAPGSSANSSGQGCIRSSFCHPPQTFASPPIRPCA